MTELPQSQFAGLLRELTGLASAVAVARAALVAEAEARGVPESVGERSVGGWLQRALRLTRSEASRDVRLSSCLLAVPAVSDALSHGGFSAAAAEVVAAALIAIEARPQVAAETNAAAEATAIRLATQLHAADLRRAMDKLRETLTTAPDVDDEAEAERLADAAARAWRDRYLHINTATGRINGQLPLSMAQALQTALNALTAHRSRDLPPEALAAAAAAGATIWIDHIEDCPADLGAPTGGGWATAEAAAAAGQAGAAVAAEAHATARSRNRPAAGDSDTLDPHATAATFDKSCRCPWRVAWPMTCTCEGETVDASATEQIVGPSHRPECAMVGDRGHEESGHPLLRRTRAQSQADAIFELARLGLDARILPTQDAAPPHLTLHATPADLDQPVPLATYPDGVYVPPGALAAVLCDATVTPVLFDTAGRTLGIGVQQQSWPKYLRRAIAARDVRCAFPGCEAVPALCHIHHMTHYSDGGSTSEANGCLLCPLHHTLVHDLGWGVRLNPRNGRPEFQPPRFVDDQQRWRQHPRYQLEHFRRTGQRPRPEERDPRRPRAAERSPCRPTHGPPLW
ncbi:MAG: DUF222 domain-containing protein [Actinomycetes bacterium]